VRVTAARCLRRLLSVGLVTLGGAAAGTGAAATQATPAVAIRTPAAGAALPAGHIVVSGTASRGVVRVAVSVDGGPARPARGSRRWSFRWDARRLRGAHTVVVRATDGHGRRATARRQVRLLPPPGSTAAAAGIAAGTRRDWPCAGCLTRIPPHYDPRRPAALVVALHGDEGTPALIHDALAGATDAAQAILFAPQCPTALGCRLPNGNGFTNSWWGWLQYAPTYDDGWIGRQVAAIRAVYRVDAARRYLVGWSGGADYLGWYALRHSDRFAAAAFIAGGVPYAATCPRAGFAAYFLSGAADPRYLSGQPSAVQARLRSCGAETEAVVLPGADHQGAVAAVQAQGYATTVVRWLLRHCARQ
jgi:poly(3-hydroxybutyrate) depolymerase